MIDQQLQTVLSLDRAQPGVLELLGIHQFRDDMEAHDDEKQQQLVEQFTADFYLLVTALTCVWGAPDSLTNGGFDRRIPLCGIGMSAGWRHSNCTVFVAFAHEDRELPFLLVAGTIPAGPPSSDANR